MTFRDEDTRLRFHTLPTATQVLYNDWEARLAQRGSRLHIDDVIAVGAVSEIIVRITENFKLSAVESDSSVTEHKP